MSSSSGLEAQLLTISRDTNREVRVLVVDRDPMTADLLSTVLTRDRHCHATATRPSDLLGSLATHPADIVVIGSDIGLGSTKGFDVASSVSRAHPKVAIVILLDSSEHDSVVKAFRSGAKGVFSRQQPMSEFLECIDQVRKGYIWAGRSESLALLSALKRLPSTHSIGGSSETPLTSRELQAVQCAATGKTNRAIAKELGLSEHTVKNYLFRAFEKLGVSSRVELLFYLTLHGQLPTSGPRELVPSNPPVRV